MSADPDAPTDPDRRSGGHIIRNMIYRHDNSHNLEIMTGWTEQGTREYNQNTVPPAKTDLPKRHPCYVLNSDLLRCSEGCPQEMKLAGRIAMCNSERHAAMRCFVKSKNWREEPSSRWSLW